MLVGNVGGAGGALGVAKVAKAPADGNTCQTRLLADGGRHRVLKNFPSAHELTARMAGMGIRAAHRQWDHDWALSYLT